MIDSMMAEVVFSEAEKASLSESFERASFKCDRCRKDRKKCLTNGVLNDLSHQKCDRCLKLYHDCGPRHKAKISGRRESTVGRSMPANETTIEISNTADTQTSTVMLDAKESISCLHALQRILLRCRCENAALLVRVPHDKAFLRGADFIENVVSRLDLEYSKLSSHQHALFDLTTKEETLSWLLALSFDMLHLQYQHMRLKLGAMHYREEKVYLPFWSKLEGIYTPPTSHEHLICTQNVLQSLDPSTLKLTHNGVRVNTINVEMYNNAEAQMQTVLDVICAEKRSMGAPSSSPPAVVLPQKKPCFPAAIVAYCNLDQEAAFKLTTENGGLYLPSNMFNQNVLHLAVISRDIGFLKRLKDFDTQTFTKAAILGDGYTPVDLSTILDDVDMFSLLLGRCYNTLPQTAHLLHLAVIAKSAGIVDIILDYGRIVLPPYTAVTELAIELGSEDIAIKFIPWLRLPWTTAADEQKLLDMAQMKGMTNMTERLLHRVPPIDTAQTALDSIQEQLDFLANDDLTDMYSFSQEGNGMLFTSTGYSEDT